MFVALHFAGSIGQAEMSDKSITSRTDTNDIRRKKLKGVALIYASRSEIPRTLLSVTSVVGSSLRNVVMECRPVLSTCYLAYRSIYLPCSMVTLCGDCLAKSSDQIKV